MTKKLRKKKAKGGEASGKGARAAPSKGSGFRFGVQKSGARGQEPGANEKHPEAASSKDAAGSDGALLALLTDREREVLRLYTEECDAKAVARRLGTKAQTVRNQLASIEHKLGVEGREALIAFALRHGF